MDEKVGIPIPSYYKDKGKRPARRKICYKKPKKIGGEIVDQEKYILIKDSFDKIVSLFFLIILLPVFTIIGILIKFDSKGNAIITQKRVGQHGKAFDMYKFRTMRCDTPSLPTAELGNPKVYITRVGSILRKTSLDELPQLINVIKGDMALIGPRPVLLNEYNLLSLRKKAGVERVKPGITGLAQISGRDFISDKRKVAYDKYYALNMCFLLDAKIIYRTFIAVFKRENVKV